jgi:hypothetical protein
MDLKSCDVRVMTPERVSPPLRTRGSRSKNGWTQALRKRRQAGDAEPEPNRYGSPASILAGENRRRTAPSLTRRAPRRSATNGKASITGGPRAGSGSGS